MDEIDPSSSGIRQISTYFSINGLPITIRRARALESGDGFLFPYRKHYFVCKPEVVAALGMDPNDSDRKKIGCDCVRPTIRSFSATGAKA